MTNRFAKAALAMALILCLLAGSSALAYDKLNTTVFDQSSDDSYQVHIESAAVASDAVYVIADETLYRWTPDMTEPEKLAMQVFSRSGGGAMDVQEPLIVSDMFTSGKAVYCLDREKGDIKRIVDENGALLATPEKLCTIDLSFMVRQIDDYVDTGSLSGVCVVGDEVFLVSSSFNGMDMQGQLMRYSLSTGELLKQEDDNAIVCIVPYAEGKLLLLCENELGAYNDETGEENPSQIYEYDIATGARTLLTTALSSNDTGLCYDAATGKIYFASGSTIYALDDPTTTPRPSAYLPDRVWRNSGYGCGLLDGGIYIYANWDNIMARGLDMPGIENGALVVYGEFGSQQHKAVVNANPDMSIAVADEWLDSIEQLTNMMVSGDSTVDVMLLDSSITPVKRLIQKGYALCLSDYPEITAIADTMEQAFLEPFMQDGKLYAVPIRMNTQSFGYNPTALEELGLTVDDLPHSFPELMDFVSNYYYDYGEEHQDIKLFDDLNIKNALLRRYMEYYVAWQMKDKGEISFDTEEMRSFLKSLDAIDFTEIDPYAIMGDKFWEDNETSEEFWQKTSLFTIYFGVNGPESFQEGSDYTKVMPISLTADSDVLVPAGLTVLMINPRTTRPQEAVRYVASYLNNLDKTSSAYSLFPGNNEPLLNANFEQDKERMEKTIETIKTSLETADAESKASIQTDLEYYEKELQNFERYRYEISEYQVKAYREQFAPYLYPVLQTPLSDYSGTSGNTFDNLMMQYVDGALDLDRFLKEMDNRIRMMMLEDM